MCSEMQGHQDKAPISAEHMPLPGKGGKAHCRFEGKHMTGQEDAACRQAGYIRAQQQIHSSAEYPGGRILSPRNGFEPSKIQYMVDSEQHQHSASQPLMGRLTNQAVRHENRQESGHEDVSYVLCISSIHSRCGKPSRRYGLILRVP